jgi:hypothetical protein
MITPHVRPDTDTYHFAVTQPTLASETFPAGADHCVTEPYRGAAPRRRTRAPVGPRPAGRPGPCHRGSTLRVADAVAAHLSVRQTKSAPTTRVNDVLACRPVRCADSRNSDREPGDRNFPIPPSRSPDSRSSTEDAPTFPPDAATEVRICRCILRTAARKCSPERRPSVSSSTRGTRKYPPAPSTPAGRCSPLRIVGQADSRTLRPASLHPQTAEAAEEPADPSRASGSPALRGTAERGVGGASGGCRDGSVGDPVVAHAPTQSQDPARRHHDRRQDPARRHHDRRQDPARRHRDRRESPTPSPVGPTVTDDRTPPRAGRTVREGVPGEIPVRGP